MVLGIYNLNIDFLVYYFQGNFSFIKKGYQGNLKRFKMANHRLQ